MESTQLAANPHSRRGAQFLAWAVLAIFVLGFFVPVIGFWTGPILGTWFAGTQRPLRGFLWLCAFALVPTLIFHWRVFPISEPGPALALWILLAVALSVLPFVAHRMLSPWLPGVLSTLPLPLAGVIALGLADAFFPRSAASLFFYSPARQLPTPLFYAGAVIGDSAVPFFTLWFASAVLWLWITQFGRRNAVIAVTAWAGALAALATWTAFRISSGAALPHSLAEIPLFTLACLAALLPLAAFALRTQRATETGRFRDPGLLRSPATGAALELVRSGRREELVSTAGEHFPMRNGIPILLRPEDLTGLNLKYNHLYETVGGFYDDIQRVVSALIGMDRDAYVMSYFGLLDVKPGDRVLETSVGTGLNFKYLPRDIRRVGLDLSAEMLLNCQANLRRWQMDADLIQGNAECLPFADSSFDAVFHVGGINFFSDRARAIREMIRVARPGTLILIADETEEHVKKTYERGPITRSYFKNRPEPVKPPVDLVPAEMLDVRLATVWRNRFYALTFRKPPEA